MHSLHLTPETLSMIMKGTSLKQPASNIVYSQIFCKTFSENTDIVHLKKPLRNKSFIITMYINHKKSTMYINHKKN